MYQMLKYVSIQLYYRPACPILPIIGHLKVKSLKEVSSLERWRYVKGFQGFTPVKMCSLSLLAVPFSQQAGTSEEISTEILPRGQEHSLTFSSLFVKVPAFAWVGDEGGGGYTDWCITCGTVCVQDAVIAYFIAH